jgi:hypothetical protein
MNDNEAGEIRRAAVREKDPGILRRWVLRLLEDREEQRRQVSELKAQLPPPARPISTGVVNDPRGRVEGSE